MDWIMGLEGAHPSQSPVGGGYPNPIRMSVMGVRCDGYKGYEGYTG